MTLNVCELCGWPRWGSYCLFPKEGKCLLSPDRIKPEDIDALADGIPEGTLVHENTMKAIAMLKKELWPDD